MANALREIFAFLGVKFDDKELKKGDKATKDATESLKNLAETVAIGFGIDKIRDFVSSTLKMSNEIRQAAIQVGATNAEISALTAQFRQVGLETDDVADAISILQEKAVDATQGSQDAADAFKNLGIEFKDSNGNILSGIELFNRTADTLAAMENPSKRVGQALILLGDPGRKLVPIFNQGTEGLQRFRREAEELGGVQSEDFFRITEEMTRETNRFSLALSGLQSKISVVILPTITRATELLTKLAVGFGKLSEKTDFLKVAIPLAAAALVALGIQVSAAWAGPIATLALAVASITIIALAVDDLITTFRGGKSVIQGVIDETLGFGTTALLLKAVKLIWDDITSAIDRAKAAVTGFLRPLGLVREEGFSRTERGARDIEVEQQGRIEGGRINRVQRGARQVEGEEILDPLRRSQLEGQALRGIFTDIQDMRGVGTRGIARERNAQRRGEPLTISTGDPIIGDNGRIIGREAPIITRRQGDVSVGPTSVALTINAQDASAREVAIIARRELETILENERRRTLEAFGDSEVE